MIFLHPNKLFYLDNNIGNQGIIHLIESLMKNNSLTKLDISGNIYILLI